MPGPTSLSSGGLETAQTLTQSKMSGPGWRGSSRRPPAPIWRSWSGRSWSCGARRWRTASTYDTWLSQCPGGWKRSSRGKEQWPNISMYTRYLFHEEINVFWFIPVSLFTKKIQNGQIFLRRLYFRHLYYFHEIMFFKALSYFKALSAFKALIYFVFIEWQTNKQELSKRFQLSKRFCSCISASVLFSMWVSTCIFFWLWVSALFYFLFQIIIQLLF